MLTIGKIVGRIKLLIMQTPQRSKGKRSRSQGQMQIVRKNIKYMPKTSSYVGNIPVL